MSARKNTFFLILKISIITILCFICFLPLIANSLHMINGCYNVYDFGIYQQAIYELTRMESWNPYLTLRNIFVFHEHFDPVIYLAIPFALISRFNPLALLVFEWLCFFGIILFTMIKLNKDKSVEEIIFAVFIICFSRSILSALHYAIHPSTWAVAPLFFLIYFFYRNNLLGVVTLSIFLFFFKETFAFGIFLFSFYFLRKKTIKTFAILFISSLFFILFELKFRRIWLGNTYQYGNQFLGRFLDNPWHFFSVFHYKAFFKVFIPYAIPIFFLIKKELEIYKNFRSTKIFGVFLLLLPMMAIHFIIDRFSSHHASQFGIVLSAACIWGNTYSLLKKHKILFFITVVLFILTSSSIIKKMIRVIVTQKSQSCILSTDKRHDIKIIKNYFNNQDISNFSIWSTGGIAVNILKPGMKIYHLHNHTPQPEYTHLLLEINQSGDTFPLNREEVNDLLKRCKLYSNNIILQNDRIYFAEGRYPYGCIKPL